MMQFSPTSLWVRWLLWFLFVEQTASLVVAAVCSYNVTLFAVVASCRSMSITNIITMCPAIVVVESVVLFWWFGCRIWVAAIVVSQICCKALCLLTAFDEFPLVPIELCFIDGWAWISWTTATSTTSLLLSLYWLLSLPVQSSHRSVVLPAVFVCWYYMAIVLVDSRDASLVRLLISHGWRPVRRSTAGTLIGDIVGLLLLQFLCDAC